MYHHCLHWLSKASAIYKMQKINKDTTTSLPISLKICDQKTKPNCLSTEGDSDIVRLEVKPNILNLWTWSNHGWYHVLSGWQKLCEGTKGLRRKVWSRTRILSPNIRILSRYQDLLQFTHFLEIFGQKKCFYGSKKVFLGQEVHYYMVYLHIILS